MSQIPTTIRDAYERNASTISGIGRDRIRTRFDSMEDIFQEISQLVIYVREDRAAFEAIPRFDLTNIDSLEDRLHALIFLFGHYREIALNKSDAQKQYDALEPAAHELKRDVIEPLQFVFEEIGDDTKLNEINEIARGTGRKDLFCDYAQLTHIVQREKETLISMGVPATIVEDMNDVFSQFVPIFGALDATPEEVEERALLVQQAYTWLDEAASTIRRYGKFAFRNNPEKLDRYKSKTRVQAGKARAAAEKLSDTVSEE